MSTPPGHIIYTHAIDERPEYTQAQANRPQSVLQPVQSGPKQESLPAQMKRSHSPAMPAPNTKSSAPLTPTNPQRQTRSQSLATASKQQPTDFNPAAASLLQSSPLPSSSLCPVIFIRPTPFLPEDIIMCVDLDREVDSDLKPPAALPPGIRGGPNGAPTTQGISRMNAIRQGLLLLVYAKLQMDSRHRFRVATIGEKFSWVMPSFSSDVAVISSAIRNIRSTGSHPVCDLLPLFQIAGTTGMQGLEQGRLTRLILVYGRSTVVPTLSRPWGNTRRVFAADALYLHDRQSSDNYVQHVYDTLVANLEAVSTHHSYVFENSTGTAKAVFRYMTNLASHPDQRVEQDEIDFPKDLSKSLGIEEAGGVGAPLAAGAWPALSSQHEKPKESTKNVSSGSSLWMRGGGNGKKGRKGGVSEEDKKNPYSLNPP